MLTAITIAGAAIRLHFMYRTMRYDEAWTFLHYASKPLWEALSSYSAPNNHILHTVLVHFISLAFGSQPFVLRLPAFVCGVALIPLTFLFGRELFGAAAGLLAATFVAFSAPLIEYSTNARGYTMYVAASTIAFILASRLFREPNRRRWILLTVCCTLGFFTIPVMAYPFLTLLLWMLYRILRVPKSKISIVHLVLFATTVGAFTLLLYSPMLASGGISAIRGNTTLAPKSFGELIQAAPGWCRHYWQFVNERIPGPLAIIIAGAFVFTLLFPSLRDRRARSLLICLLIAPVCLAVIARNWPFGRIMTYALPLYFAAAAAGLINIAHLLFSLFHRQRAAASRWPTGPVAAMALSILLVPGLFTAADGYYPQEFPHGNEAVAVIAARLKPGDAILAEEATDTPLEYYVNRYGIPFHHVVADKDWIFNAYAQSRFGLPDRNCWTRLIGVVSQGYRRQSIEKLVKFMGEVGPLRQQLIWSAPDVAVYELTRPPDVLARMESSGQNLVLNPGFEAGAVCWWDEGSASITSTSPRSGRSDLQIGPSAGGTFQEVPMAAGGRYRLNVWVRLRPTGATLDPSDKAWVGVSLTGSGPKDDKRQLEITSPGWQRCSLDLDSPLDLKRASVWAWKENGHSYLEVDDLDLEPMR